MGIATYNANNLPGDRGAAKKFYEWARKQAKQHGKASEISDWDKAQTYSYILQYYNTWGDVLNAARSNALAEKVTEKEIKAIDQKILNPTPKKKTEWELTLEGMAASYSGYSAAVEQLPENQYRAQAFNNARGQTYLLNILKEEKPGSEKYNNALAALKKSYADAAAAFEAESKRTGAIALAKNIEKRKELVDALTRAQDYGTTAQVTAAQDALNKFDNKNPDVKNAKPETPATGKVPAATVGVTSDPTKGILKNGKPYSGTYVAVIDGKTYEYQLVDGHIPDKGTYKVYNKDGTFKTFDANTDKEIKAGAQTSGAQTSAATSGAQTSGATTRPQTSGATSRPQTSGAQTSGTYTPPSTVNPNIDPKGLWVSALKQTFKTGIDDPKQKAEIDKLIDTAKTQKWTEATFMEALKLTGWWKATLPTLRQFYIDSHDPRNAATFAQTMINKVDSVQASMEKLGIKVNDIDPVTGKVIDNTAIIKGIAAQALQYGWDDNQIQEHLATKAEVIFTGGGTLGSNIATIKQQALNYGISLDANQLATINRDLLNPQDGKDTAWYLNNIKQMAIDANPAFAAPLKEGRTLYEVTSAYRKQMADLLEVDTTNITWNDLMNKVINKDKGTANTFADFTKLVKQDPLWQRTKNAKETYSNMANDLLRQFGFLG